jgi:hypothetical protein
MPAATRFILTLAAVAGLCGCAKLGSSLNLASATSSPAKPAPVETAPAAAAPSLTAQAAPAGPTMLPPLDAVAHPPPAPHEAAKPPSWGLWDVLAPYRSTSEHEEEAPPPPSEFTTVAGVQVSPAAVPTKDELLAKLKARSDVDAAEYERWEKIVQSTPEDDWPLVALQLQAVLNYKTFQAVQGQETESRGPGPEIRDQEPGVNGAQATPEVASSRPEAAPSPTPSPPATPTAAGAKSEPPPPAAPQPEAAPAETPKVEAPSAALPPTPASSTASPPAEGAKPDVLPPSAADKAPQPLAATESVPESTPAAPSDHWREHLERAIEALEAELQNGVPDAPAQVVANSAPASSEEYRTQAARQRQRARKEAFLRLLYLAVERNADAARGVEDFAPPEREFWKHQVHGLGVFLDDQGAPVADRRARLALRELQEGMHHLAAASGLDVRNLAFCPQVFSFGNFVEFAPSEFRPGQEVLLYAEIDHFAVESRPDGFETELQGSYQIFDGAGRRVAEHVFPPEKEVCRNRRRDYFVPFRMYLPNRIDPGPYTLQLTVEDLKGQKFGQSSIRFAIVP